MTCFFIVRTREEAIFGLLYTSVTDIALTSCQRKSESAVAKVEVKIVPKLK